MAESFLRMLLIDLEIFAAEAEVAVRAFRPLGLSTRDNTIAGLANDFFGYLDYVSEKVVAAGLVSREMLAPAHRMATTMQEMSRAKGEDLWTDEAFRTRDEWTAVRRLATETIRALGYVVEVPRQSQEISSSRHEPGSPGAPGQKEYRASNAISMTIGGPTVLTRWSSRFLEYWISGQVKLEELRQNCLPFPLVLLETGEDLKARLDYVEL